MNTESQFYDRSHSQVPSDVSNGMAQPTNELTGATDMDKCDSLRHKEADRFELLSAYLDGEVTAAERRQVEEWLVTDDSLKCLYQRLLKLRQGVRSMPIPASQQSPEVTFQQVWKRLRCRYQLAWMAGGAAVAACVIGSISGLIPGNTTKLQIAQQKIQPIAVTTQPAIPASPLMVAINNPVIEIPKTAVASPITPVNESKEHAKETELDIN
ncbi:zf-HC2 domain-containing protein [Sphaerospermopsis aphanizomenoides BCCUSP55]|uniref:anti-sigma factor family protein n=1 Tax=Sphaerospermopsis aphanizomenoides TaxID=459663 RepID=UPI0019062FCE|nr:zf-HC2 domain-containing protein [Sphaerospermopsis aphanizomenoides]MBK1988018.1 zf-HC2 domain-containing protein [Sphaerospermopsis aphanizomenoides BCCUSP55]